MLNLLINVLIHLAKPGKNAGKEKIYIKAFPVIRVWHIETYHGLTFRKLSL